MSNVLQQFSAFFTTLSLASAVVCNAQPAWQWGVRGNDSGPVASNHRDDVIDMATDPEGAVYILSTVFTAGDVAGLPVAGVADVISARETIVLSSFDCNGQYRWHKIIGGTAGDNRAAAVKTDTLGGVYVTGNVIAYASHPDPVTFPDSLLIDRDSVSGSTNKGLFIVKYDTAGNYQWLRMPQPDTVSYLTSISHTGSLDMDVAPDGNVFVYCILSPGIYGDGAFEITEKQVCILHYDKNGIFRNNVPVDLSLTSSSIYDIEAFTNPSRANFKRDHASGHFYLSGTFEGYYGSMTVGSDPLVYSGGYAQKFYIASFDSTGNANWLRQTTPADTGTFGSGSGTNSRVAIDPSGNIYATGFVMAGDSWYGHEFENDYDESTRATPFVMKLDSEGNTSWVTTPEKDLASNGNAFQVVYTNGLAAVSGVHGQMTWDGFELRQSEVPPGENVDVFIGRFNAETGALLSLDTLNSNYGAEEYVTAITADKNGNLFTGGYFYEDLFVAGAELTNAYFEDWFVAKLGSSVCGCSVPVADFSYSVEGANTVTFTYTGTTPYTSIQWDFGDGDPVAVAANPTHTYGSPGNYTVCVTVSNDCGSYIYCLEVNTSGSLINSVTGFSDVSIYPNPSAHAVHIDNAEPGTLIEIYDVSGRRRQQTIIKSKHTVIDIGHLSSGIYLLRLIDKYGVQGMSKLVKQ